MSRPAPLGRRIVAAVAGVTAAALLAWGAWQGYQATVSLPIQRVVYAGEIDRLAQPELDALTHALLAAPSAPLQAIRASARRVPWVRDATVRRLFPDAVEITFSAYTAFARWNDSQLVSPTGEVFAAPEAGKLPQLRGPDASAPQVVREYAAGRGRAGADRRGRGAAPHAAWRVARDPRLRPCVGARARRMAPARRALRGRVAAPGRRGAGGHPCRPALSRRLRVEAGRDVDPPPREAQSRMITPRQRDTRHLLVALDIGTSKIVTLVAEVTPEDTLNMIGMGSHPSRGLKKGVVVNIESTVNAIQRSLEEAELMADAKIRDVITGIAGSHIKSFNSHGMVAIKDKEVQQYDIERVIETARAVNIPMEQQVLHILEQEFIIDGQGGVRQPLGMSGMRLEVKVHIVTGAVSAAQNIMKCVRRCGLEVKDLMLQPLASADAVLLDDERDLGVCLVDIGGGTTDIAVFTDGAIKHTSVIPIAGDQITNDIAMALRTPTRDAEELKISHGVALRQLASPADMIEVPGVGERGPRELSRQTLAEVIEPRVEELYSLIQRELRSSGLEELLSSGIVITGGSALMKGMVELGEEVFHMPVRVGVPHYTGALSEVVRSPRYATGMGLLMAGLDQVKRDRHARMQGQGFKEVMEKMKGWFKGNF
jgi:cell division protein FtsA